MSGGRGEQNLSVVGDSPKGMPGSSPPTAVAETPLDLLGSQELGVAEDVAGSAGGNAPLTMVPHSEETLADLVPSEVELRIPWGGSEPGEGVGSGSPGAAPRLGQGHSGGVGGSVAGTVHTGSASNNKVIHWGGGGGA